MSYGILTWKLTRDGYIDNTDNDGAKTLEEAIENACKWVNSKTCDRAEIFDEDTGEVFKVIERKLFRVEARETGDWIEECETYEEAEKIVEEFEQDDRAEGTYVERFYAISKWNGERYETI